MCAGYFRVNQAELQKPTIPLLLSCVVQQHSSLAGEINIAMMHAQSGVDITKPMEQLAQGVKSLQSYVDQIRIAIELKGMQQPEAVPPQPTTET